ncbi:MAG: hypothetical protein ACRYG4_04115 [Janthinobacterium lividum]
MGISNDAPRYLYSPDPGDDLDYGFDVSELLDGETVNLLTLTITLDAATLALGVQIETDGQHAPGIAGDGVTLVYWLNVAAAHQADPVFDRFGVEFMVTVAFYTTHTPPRHFERSAIVTERNR